MVSTSRGPASERPPAARGWTFAAWLLCAAAFAYPAWRAALPNNQHRETDLAELPPAHEWFTPESSEVRGKWYRWGQDSDGYDDFVTVVTARNFARDGFLRTHLLPNRKGAPNASFLDFHHGQCLELEPVPGTPLMVRSPAGEWLDLRSVRGDCIYTHYPPLADWIFGAMAAVGLESILAYRLLAIAVSCATLLLLFLWLQREVHPAAALTAVGLVAFAPVFFHWAAALFHVSFQYLFLAGGLVTWSRFLEGRRWRWFLATAALFFLEAMVSYELIAFFAIALAGMVALDGGGASWARRIGWLALQGLAPIVAVLLHVALRVSLFGLGPTWSNLVRTAVDRATDGWNEQLQALWRSRVELNLLRFDLALLALVLVLVVRFATRTRPWRALSLLGVLLAGGASFLALFPSTGWRHAWMMYRHFLPAAILLLAYVADAGLICLSRAVLGAGAAPARARWVRAAAAIGAAVAVLPLAWFGYQSARALRRDHAWQRSTNAHVDPRNQAVRFLDVVQWFETGTPFYDPRALMAVSGRRVNEPSHVPTVSWLQPAVRQHFELWWLDDVAASSVRFLGETWWIPLLRARCTVSAFDGERFQVLSGARARVEPFQPDDGEPTPAAAESWWIVPLVAPTRALRLTCEGLPEPVHLSQIEVRAGEP